MLSILKQNPSAVWKELISEVEVKADSGDDMREVHEDYSDELQSFQLGAVH